MVDIHMHKVDKIHMGKVHTYSKTRERAYPFYTRRVTVVTKKDTLELTLYSDDKLTLRKVKTL